MASYGSIPQQSGSVRASNKWGIGARTVAIGGGILAGFALIAVVTLGGESAHIRGPVRLCASC
jgi:hypothetical protein